MEIELFQDWLLRKGRQKRTIEKHLLNLSVLSRLLADWSVSSINALIVGFIKSGKRNATINSFIDTIRLYSQFMGFCPELCNYKHLPKQHTLKQVLSNEEIDKLLSLPCPPKCNPKTWHTDTVYLKTLAWTGARPGEIAVLKKCDIDGENIKIMQSKTGYPRLIPLVEPLKSVLFDYLKTIKGDFLFTTIRGKTYSDHNWLHMFDKRLRLLGIERPGVTIYSLRHSFITTMLRKKIDAVTIAKCCGNSPDMVWNVYSHMVLDDVADAMSQHPLLRKYSNPKQLLSQIEKTIKDFQLENDERFNFKLVETECGIELNVNVSN